jgi:hypothetical protein
LRPAHGAAPVDRAAPCSNASARGIIVATPATTVEEVDDETIAGAWIDVDLTRQRLCTLVSSILWLR